MPGGAGEAPGRARAGSRTAALLPSPDVTPLLPIVLGLAAIALGSLLLRSYGPRARVGRLLAVTPVVSIADALALARAGRRRYVRIAGRIDADEELPDESAQPLVFRRVRVEARRDRAWRLLDETRTSVPFAVRDGLDAIPIDDAALGDGLVVVPREWEATAGEVPGQLPVELPPATPVRLRTEQLSAVDHATVLGVPANGPGGRPWMTAGTGRPLVVCALGDEEAMCILAEGDRRRPLVAAGALGAGLLLLAVGLGWALLAGGFA